VAKMGLYPYYITTQRKKDQSKMIEDTIVRIEKTIKATIAASLASRRDLLLSEKW
jgi:hypothetical protein